MIRLLFTMFMCLTLSELSAGVIHEQVYFDMSVNSFVLFNPFGNLDLIFSYSSSSIEIAGDNMESVAMTTTLNGNNLSFFNCGDVIGSSSVTSPSGSTPVSNGDFYLGFVLYSDYNEQFFGWLHCNYDEITNTLILIEYAFEEIPGLNIEVCNTQGGFSLEDCENGIDDDGDGYIDEIDTDCPCFTVNTGNLILNPDVEQHGCIPQNFSLFELECVSSVVNFGTGSTDYLHMDGFYPESFPPPHSGSAVIGAIYFDHLESLSAFNSYTHYQESFGLGISESLEAGTNYEFRFFISQLSTHEGVVCDETTVPFTSPLSYETDVDIVLYGFQGDSGIPYGNPFLSSQRCPSDYDSGWIPLGTVSVSFDSEWTEYQINFSCPVGGIDEIVLGWACDIPEELALSPSVDCRPYSLFDDFYLARTSSNSFVASVEIEELGNGCAGIWRLNADANFFVTNYQWFLNGEIIPGETQALLDLNQLGLAQGEYTVAVRGPQRCADQSIGLSEPTLNIQLDANVPGLLCGLTEYEIELEYNSSLNLDFTWTSADGNIVAGENSANVLVNQTGAYEVNVTYGICEVSESFDLVFSDLEPPSAAFNSSLGIDCEYSPLFLEDQSTTSEEIIQLLWSVAGEEGEINGPNAEFSLLNGNDYQVTLFVLDDQGCSDEETQSISVPNYDGPIADFEVIPNFEELNVELLDQSVGEVISWVWSTGDGTSYNSQNTAHQYAEGGPYIITLTVSDELGCENSDQVSILFKEPVFAYIPNAFSPNGDGVNEYWKWSLVGADQVKVLVFNRWGQEIFSSTDLDGVWQGNVDNGDHFVEAGVYAYKISFRQGFGVWEERAGSIAVIR